jgi:hypothetical protein
MKFSTLVLDPLFVLLVLALLLFFEQGAFFATIPMFAINSRAPQTFDVTG